MVNMKKIIAILLSIIAIVLIFAGCTANEQPDHPKAWIDDIDALFVKIKRMNEYSVHNLLGEPLAHVIDQKSDVYLDNQEIAVFIFYDNNGTVERVEREKPYETQENQVSAEKRCQIMNKLMGRNREQLISRYGEFSSNTEDLSVCRYDDFEGVQVAVYFDGNGTVEKLLIKANGKVENSSEAASSSDENTINPIELLDDMGKLNNTVIGMGLRDFLNLFGDPKGIMEEENCRVYLDSNKNGVFFYFDDMRNVCSIEKVTVAGILDKDKYLLPDTQLITVLINEFEGKSKRDIFETYGAIKYIGPKSNYYGYKNLYGKKVDVYFDDENILKRVIINSPLNNEKADDKIEDIQKEMVGKSVDRMSNTYGVINGAVSNKKYYAYFNNLGNGIFFHFNEKNIIYKVEEIKGNDIKNNGVKNEKEKLTMLMSKLLFKSEEQIEAYLGKPDKVFSPHHSVRYNNVDGEKINIYYDDDGFVKRVYVL